MSTSAPTVLLPAAPSPKAMALVGRGLVELRAILDQTQGDPDALDRAAAVWSEIAEGLRFRVGLPLASATSTLGEDGWQGTARDAADRQTQRFLAAFSELDIRYERNAQVLRQVAGRLRSTRLRLDELWDRLTHAGAGLAGSDDPAVPTVDPVVQDQADMITARVLTLARGYAAELDRYLGEAGGVFAQMAAPSFEDVTYEVPWFGGGRPPEWAYQVLPRWLFDPEPSLRIDNGELVSEGVATWMVPSSTEAQLLVTGSVLANNIIGGRIWKGNWVYPFASLPAAFARNLPTYSLAPVTDPYDQPGYMALYNGAFGAGATVASDAFFDRAGPYVQEALRRTGALDWLSRRGVDTSQQLLTGSQATPYVAVANFLTGATLSMKPYVLEKAGLGSFDEAGRFRPEGVLGTAADIGYDLTTIAAVNSALPGLETLHRTGDPYAVGRTVCANTLLAAAGTFGGRAFDDQHDPRARLAFGGLAAAGLVLAPNCDRLGPPPPPPPSGSPTPVEAVRAPYVPEEIPDPWLTWARDPELNPGLREDPGFQRRHLLNQVGTEAAFLGGATVLSAGALTGVGALGGLPTVTGLGSSAGPLTPLVPAAPLLAF